MSDAKDPWASLADSLGASPNRDASPPPAQRPPEKPRQPPRADAAKTPPPRSGAGWDGLDTSLGLPPTRESTRPPERRVERTERTERPPRAERADRGERAARGDAVAGEPREGDQQRGVAGGDDAAGEGRPRRRRGRRGGRGRGSRGRRDDGMAAPQREESHSSHADLDHASADDRPAARGDDFDHEPRSADRDSAEPALDEDGRPRRRRRRRGRRGGRRAAGAGERPGDHGGEGAAPQSSSERPASDHDHEPLPSGYGRGQTSRQAESREPAPRTEGGERRGRRRRRGRGDEPSRRPAAEGGGESARRRGRSGRRSSDSERTSSSSSLARRSRDDFAPVARGYDEDDEGLEFLGLEESGHEQPRREDRHVEDDDVLVESGLNAVRDVPSWVEAIGIVIAGNLDARSRPRADRGDDDRRRR